MPAHLKPLVRICRVCGKSATVEVFDRWNGSRGVHCRPCGQREVDRLNRDLPSNPAV